jgi:hypothetical protein
MGKIDNAPGCPYDCRTSVGERSSRHAINRHTCASRLGSQLGGKH